MFQSRSTEKQADCVGKTAIIDGFLKKAKLINIFWAYFFCVFIFMNAIDF